MEEWIGRRAALAVVGAVTAAAAYRTVWAQPASGRGLLGKLQAAKMVKVGVANQPPYSALNPDGTLTGAAPDFTKVIMGRLGIHDLAGLVRYAIRAGIIESGE